MGIPCCCCRSEGCCLQQEPTCWLIEAFNVNNDCGAFAVGWMGGASRWWLGENLESGGNLCHWECVGGELGGAAEVDTVTLTIQRIACKNWKAYALIGTIGMTGEFQLEFDTDGDCWQPEQLTLPCIAAPSGFDAADLTCRITPYFADEPCHACCDSNQLCAMGQSPASFTADIPISCFSGMYVLERIIAFGSCVYRYVDGDVTIEILPLATPQTIFGLPSYFGLKCIRYQPGSGGSIIQDFAQYRMNAAFLAIYTGCRQCNLYEDIEMELVTAFGFYDVSGACGTVSSPSSTDPAFVTAVPLA